MTATYHIKEKELDESFLNQLKSIFKNKNLVVTITEEMDETEYLLSSEANKKQLENSIKNIEDGHVTVFSLNEFQEKYGNK